MVTAAEQGYRIVGSKKSGFGLRPSHFRERINAKGVSAFKRSKIVLNLSDLRGTFSEGDIVTLWEVANDHSIVVVANNTTLLVDINVDDYFLPPERGMHIPDYKPEFE